MTDQLRSKLKETSWGETQQRSFKKLKVAFATTPILDIVDPNEPFVLETDANGKAIRVVLMQGGYPIAVRVRNLIACNGSTWACEWKLLAIIYALKKWHHYLYGATFEVWMDHESLKWLSSLKD